MNPNRIRVIPKDEDMINFDEPEQITQTYQRGFYCELCHTKGAYTIDGDPAQIGFCMKHIKETYKEVLEID